MRTPSKSLKWIDPESGLVVRQLTWGSHPFRHLYFTHPGWLDNGRELVVLEDQPEGSDVHVLDLESGDSRQVTHFQGDSRHRILAVAVDVRTRKGYLFLNEELRCINLDDGEQQVICGPMEGFVSTPPSLSADGRYIFTSYHEALFPAWTQGPKLSLETRWRMKPLSRVARIDCFSGKREVLHEERCYIKHVNASPTQPHLLTFCHEGPWILVDARIWALDTRRQQVWCVRPRQASDERLGHEYWLSDGLTLGYHGHYHHGTERVQPFFGFIRFDGTDGREQTVPRWADGYHYHSLDGRIAVSDGTVSNPRLLLWNKDQQACWQGPFVVARHGSTVSNDWVHVHPSFAPDERKIVYTSDLGGIGQVYLAELPKNLANLRKIAENEGLPVHSEA